MRQYACDLNEAGLPICRYFTIHFCQLTRWQH